MSVNDRLSTIITLAASVYLGFYVFGLVMGVYSPGEVPYFTIPALLLVGVLAVLAVAGRRRSTTARAASRSREAGQ
jgi:hypothetical protein